VASNGAYNEVWGTFLLKAYAAFIGNYEKVGISDLQSPAEIVKFITGTPF
jgi:hypothetical protein